MTRHLHIGKRLFRIVRLVVPLVLLCLEYGSAPAGRSSLVIVENGTGYFVHVRIDDELFMYIPPGRSAQVRFDSEDVRTVKLRADYSPGQGVVGSACRKTHIATSEIEDVSCDENNEVQCDTVVHPAAEEIKWRVEAEDMQPGGSDDCPWLETEGGER